MPTALGKIRKRLLTPHASQTQLDVRGFQPASPHAQQTLETIGSRFLLGYGAAMESSRVEEVESRLERVAPRYRGFAYEGATMALTIRDALSPGGGRLVERLLAGRASDHVYVAYVGVGWAMARLPRFLWPDSDRFDPLLRWLVLDGYGFHQAYFRTARYVDERAVDRSLAWRGCHSGYAQRAVDQGIGRALWFVHGTDPTRVIDSVEQFAARRRPDLVSGVGLAATYAGGTGASELKVLWERAGDLRPELAQGAAFGAEARLRGGLVNDETRLATEVLCGTSPEGAAEVARATRPSDVVDGEAPAFEIWRQQLSGWFAAARQRA